MFSLADPSAPPTETATPQPPHAPPPAQQMSSFPPKDELPPVAVPPGQQQVPPSDVGTAPPEEPKQSVVEELASKTGKAVTDTGNAVGHAVKKSWDCVASLFGKC